MYFQTGNGDFNGTARSYPLADNYSMSLLKLATTNGLCLADYLVFNAVALSGAGSTTLVQLAGYPAGFGGQRRASSFGCGGRQYHADLPGGPGQHGDALPTTGKNLIGVGINLGRFWWRQGHVADLLRYAQYLRLNQPLQHRQWIIPHHPADSREDRHNRAGPTACISANGTKNAILWTIYNAGGETHYPLRLARLQRYEYHPQLYASDQLAARDRGRRAR